MQPIESKTSIKVFISYAHADQELRQKLEEHLSSLKYSGKITIWQDQKIPAGANWENQIDTHLHSADLLLLLISASFIASNYCWSREVQNTLLQHKAGKVRVIPIIMKPVDWKSTPLRELQALPTGAKAVTQWNEQDAALEDVTRGIREVVGELLETCQEEPALHSSPQDSPGNVLPAPAQKQQRIKLWHFWPVLRVLMLICIAVGSLVLLSIGQGTRNTSHYPPTALTLSKSHQSTAPAQGLTNATTATAQARANATTQANNVAPTATAQVNANAATQANNVAPTAITQDNASIARTWHPQSSGNSQDLGGIASSGSLFVAVGRNGTILTSPNGLSWTPRTSRTSSNLWGVAWSGSLFVAVGDSGTILTSPDGLSWTPRTSGSSSTLWGVIGSGSLFVAVGVSGTILTSPDGLSWTSQTSPTTQKLYSVTWSGSLFVAVGDSGTILTAPDGLSWTPQTVDSSSTLWGVIGSGSLFVAVGSGGTILTAPDGLSWTPRTSGSSSTLWGVSGSGSLFVAVGVSGAILTSP